MTRRIQTEELAIQHMRNRGQRMPVSSMEAKKRRDQTVARQTRRNLRVFVNIILVVVLDKGMAERLPENGPRQRGQRQIDGDEDAAGNRFRRGVTRCRRHAI